VPTVAIAESDAAWRSERFATGPVDRNQGLESQDNHFTVRLATRDLPRLIEQLSLDRNSGHGLSPLPMSRFPTESVTEAVDQRCITEICNGPVRSQ